MMDTYTYNPTTKSSAASSSSSSSYSNSSNSSAQLQQEERRAKPPPAYRSALRSVRKTPAKNIITKKPIAPMPPTPPKIYKVSPGDFRNVVQRLTAAPEFQPTRLQEVAPPPLSLTPPPHRLPFSGESSLFDSSSEALSPLGFNLSPSSLAWCSSILLSPGTLSSFEPSAVL